MNINNCLKKKDIIVIFVNLMVLLIVLYMYYIVQNLKTIILNTHVPKESTKTDISEGYTNDFDNFKITNNNVNIRHTRSINQSNNLKCNFMNFYRFKYK